MTTVPSNLVPTRISQLTEYDGLSQDGYLPYVLNGVTYKVRFGNIASVGAVPSSRTITGGGGLTGGGDLTANRVISIATGGVGYTQLADSGVTAGTYGSPSEIPVLTVDAKGRVEVASTTPISLSGYVPTSRSIIAGPGLSGGGDLSTNRTISLTLSAATPQSGGNAVAGSSTVAARDDHVHPAVDLSDTTETSGVLPLARGGTGSSLSPVAGAILYSDGSNVDMSNPGNVGDVLFSDGTNAPFWGSITGGTTGLSFGFVGPNYVLSGTLALANGGTGATTAAAARVNLLPSYAGNGGKALTLNASATDVEWQTITGLGTVTSVAVSGGTTGLTTTGGPITAAGTITIGGTLAPTSGGTGITSFAVGDLLFANTTTQLDRLTVGANGYLLASNGTAPAYVNPTTVTVGAATTATTSTNLAGGTAGSIPYQTALDTTAMLSSASGVLMGASTPFYTMTPSLTQVTVAGDPSTALQVATKQYVDGLVSSGITYHTPVKYEVPNTTGNLNATYNNGTAGVGATLTNAGTLGAFTPDGTVASVNDRILIYNQTNAFENGVYTVTTVGDGSTAWVLTRATDADSYGLKDTNALGNGDAFFITSGATGAGETYVCNTAGTITFGTTAITFVQVSSAQIYSAGSGLTLTGTTFSITAPIPTNLGGTNQTTYTDGQILIGKTDGTLAKTTVTAGTGVSVTNGDGSITIANTAPDQVVSISGGTGISTSGTYPSFTVTNTAPDQVVSITAGSNITVTGTYPNFTIAAASAGGTVTSVSGTGTVNGLTLTGTVTTSGSLVLGGTLSVDLGTGDVTGTLPVARGGTGTGTAFTTGSIVFAGASGVYSQNNNQLFWDNSNTRLGIGTTSPGSKLTVAGVIESTTGGVKFPDGSTQTAAGVSTGKAIAMSIVFGG